MNEGIVKHKWVIIICSFLLLVGAVLLYGWNFKFNGPSVTTSDWGVFGDFLSGFLGAIFGFITIALLVFFEYDRSKDALHKEDIDMIDKALNHNRDIFNSIKLHIRDYSNKYRSGPGANTIQMLEKSGPEAFLALYRNDFLAKYMLKFNIYISTNTESFVNSLSDANIQELLLHYNSTSDAKIISTVSAIQNISDKQRLLEFHKHSRLEDKFRFSLEEMPPMVINALEISSENLPSTVISQVISDAFEDFYRDRGHIYGHYIRNQFYIFETIQNSALRQSEKDSMFKLYRSHLSAFELVIMFYNSNSQKSKVHYNAYICNNDMLDSLEIVNFIHAKYFRKHRYNTISKI